MIEQFASKHGIDTKLLRAVIQVESAGSGINPDNSIKIRFENHLLLADYPNLSKWFSLGKTRYLDHFYKFPSHSTLWRNVHENYFSEYSALLTASFQIGNKSFDYASVGQWQIVMGMHHQKLGFSTSIEMYTFAASSRDNDLSLGLRFFESKPSLINSLRNRDLTAFIAEYNGSAQIPLYLSRMNQAMGRL